MQAFSWASNLKHWILKMIVWHEMVREKVKAMKTPRWPFRNQIQGQDMPLENL